MKKLLAVTVAAVLALAGAVLVASPDTAVATSVTDLCTGYAEARIPLESQAWWFPTSEDEGGTDTGRSFGHEHLEVCVPTLDHVQTSDQFDAVLHVQIHLAGGIKAPPTSTVVRIQEVEMRGKNGGDPSRDVLVDEFTGDYLTCNASEHCEAFLPVTFDLVRSPRICNCADYKMGFRSNGLKQLRLSAFSDIYVNGSRYARMRAGLRVPLNLDLEQFTTSNSYTNDTESSAWWIRKPTPGAGGYSTVRYTDPIPTEPRAPEASWTLPLEFEADPCVDNCVPDRMPTTGYEVHLDPAFHSGDPGLILAAGSWAPATGAVRRTPTVTWTGLAPGPHKLVILVHQPMADGIGGFNVPAADESTNTGVLVIPFVVI